MRKKAIYQQKNKHKNHVFYAKTKFFLLYVICLLLIIPIFQSGGSEPTFWNKVNGGNSLELNEPLMGDQSEMYFTTCKNTQGDLIYIFNSGISNTVMGRFQSGGSTPTKAWQLYSDGSWVGGASPVIPTSVTRTLAELNKPILYPLPDGENPEGFFGISRAVPKYSRSSFDIHGFMANIMFDGTELQSRYGSGYSKYYMSGLINTWSAAQTDFAFDPVTNTGIAVSTCGYDYGSDPVRPQITALKYEHTSPTPTWMRWNRLTDEEQGDWIGGNPSYTDKTALRRTFILNTRLTSGPSLNQMSSPQIIYLGDGDYLVTFFYAKDFTPQGQYYTAARYDEQNEEHWTWWDGTTWIHAGSFDYQRIFTTTVGPMHYTASSQLVKVADHQAEGLFLMRPSYGDCQLFIVPYNENEGHTGWETSTTIAGVSSFSAEADSDGTLWLYYSIGKNVYLQKKQLGGMWAPREELYESTTNIKVVDANFINVDEAEIPICFIQEKNSATNLYHIYALSSPEFSSYWSGEIPLEIQPTEESLQLDTTKIQLQHEIQTAGKPPSWPYSNSGRAGKLDVDSDGYLYLTTPAFHDVAIAHRDDQLSPPDLHLWGGSWGSLSFPGAVEQDNMRGKVYVTCKLTTAGAGSVVRNGHVAIFSLDQRTQDISSPITTFGDFGLPSDLAVDEVNGVLYVTDTLANCIKKYDLNTLDGQGRPTYLSSFGSEGTGNGQLHIPEGITIGPDNEQGLVLYVADTGNHRIQKFDQHGTYLGQWGLFGRGVGEFVYPFSIEADPTYNLIYVLEPYTCRVQVFDRDGTFLYTWNQWTEIEEASVTDFMYSFGITADGIGNIYVGVGEFQSGFSNNYYISKFSIVDPQIDVNKNDIPDCFEILETQEIPNPTPIADAGGPYQGAVGIPILFNGLGSENPQIITSYLWDFGDKTTATKALCQHTYRKIGRYTVTLTVTDSFGRSSVDTTIVRVLSGSPQSQLNGNK